MIKTEKDLSAEIVKIFSPHKEWDQETFVKLFDFLLKSKNFYKSYLSTNEQTFMEKNDFMDFLDIVNTSHKAQDFSLSERLYHMAFFAGGIKALSKSWIMNGCKETPQQMAQILTNEYRVNSKFFA